MQTVVESNPRVSVSSTQRVVSLLRLITRSIDLHSRFLAKESGLTIPQLLALQEIRTHQRVTSTEIAMSVKLSKATVSGITDRLKGKGYIESTRDADDRRKVYLALTESGKQVLARNPLPIQQEFVQNFERMTPEQQRNMLESLEVLAKLMFESSSAARDMEHWMMNRKVSDDSMH